MTLPTNGRINMLDIRNELWLNGSISLNNNDCRSLSEKSSGIIKLSDFYGKSRLFYSRETFSNAFETDDVFSPGSGKKNFMFLRSENIKQEKIFDYEFKYFWDEKKVDTFCIPGGDSISLYFYDNYFCIELPEDFEQFILYKKTVKKFYSNAYFKNLEDFNNYFKEFFLKIQNKGYVILSSKKYNFQKRFVYSGINQLGFKTYRIPKNNFILEYNKILNDKNDVDLSLFI